MNGMTVMHAAVSPWLGSTTSRLAADVCNIGLCRYFLTCLMVCCVAIQPGRVLWQSGTRLSTPLHRYSPRPVTDHNPLWVQTAHVTIHPTTYVTAYPLLLIQILSIQILSLGHSGSCHWGSTNMITVGRLGWHPTATAIQHACWYLPLTGHMACNCRTVTSTGSHPPRILQQSSSTSCASSG